MKTSSAKDTIRSIQHIYILNRPLREADSSHRVRHTNTSYLQIKSDKIERAQKKLPVKSFDFRTIALDYIELLYCRLRSLTPIVPWGHVSNTLSQAGGGWK